MTAARRIDRLVEPKFIVEFDCDTVSEMNVKGHEPWQKSQARHKTQKEATLARLQKVSLTCPFEPPLVVTVTRIAAGRGLDPFENLPSSLKYIVDTIARYVGVDDRRDDLVKYIAKQERAPHGSLKRVRIEIEPRGAS